MKFVLELKKLFKNIVEFIKYYTKQRELWKTLKKESIIEDEFQISKGRDYRCLIEFKLERRRKKIIN